MLSVEHEKSFITLGSGRVLVAYISLTFQHFSFYVQLKFHAQLSWAWKKFYSPGAWLTTYIHSYTVVTLSLLGNFHVFFIICFFFKKKNKI